jgi:hypothetical protein
MGNYCLTGPYQSKCSCGKENGPDTAWAIRVKLALQHTTAEERKRLKSVSYHVEVAVIL